MITGNAHYSLHEIEIGFAGLEEDDDVSAAHIAIVNERCPVRGRCEGDAVDQHVIADQQRFLHGRRGNGKILEDEGKSEEAQNEHAADRREGFQRCFFTTVAGLRSVFFERLLHVSCLSLPAPSKETRALANDAEDAVPPRELHYLVDRVVIVSEFIT